MSAPELILTLYDDLKVDRVSQYLYTMRMSGDQQSYVHVGQHPRCRQRQRSLYPRLPVKTRRYMAHSQPMLWGKKGTYRHLQQIDHETKDKSLPHKPDEISCDAFQTQGVEAAEGDN
jgi:hypothetical protein